MKRFFSKNGILLLSAVTIVAVVLCVVSALTSGTGILHNVAGVIAFPFRSLGATVSGWVQNVGDRFQSIETLQQENDALRRENAELRDAMRQAERDSAENEKLRSILDLRRQRRDFALESAFITEFSASNWASVLTLSKGTSSGVAIGNCVVDEYGYLVGIITDAGLNWSTVTTVLDPESQLGASVFRTKEPVVVSGDLRLMNTGKLKVEYVQSGLINGDQIVTSGLGGYYPAGLVIGTVEDILATDNGMGHYAILSPSTDLAKLTELFIITDFEVVE